MDKLEQAGEQGSGEAGAKNSPLLPYTPAPLHWTDWVITLLAAALSLALYTRTLTPGLLPGDGGEFQTLVYLLADTHPTGYPIYLLLAKALTFLPLSDVAYRVNFFSALMGALTVGGVYLAGRLLTSDRWSPLAGATALAVLPAFWSQALIAEVYTAGALFLTAIFLLLLWWDRSGAHWALFAAGLLGGLSLGVHLTVALLAPAVFLFLLFNRRRGRQNWLAAVKGAALGLALFLAAFWLIDSRPTPANYFDAVVKPSQSAWGLTADDLDNPLERLIFGLSARQFRPFMFSDIATVMPEQAADYWRNLPNEFSRLLIILAGVGLISLLWKRPSVGLFFVVGLLTHWLYTFNYAIWDLYVFYIPGYVMLAILSSAGLGQFIEWSFRLVEHPVARQLLAASLTAAAIVLAVWGVFSPHVDATLAGDVPDFGFEEYPVDSYALETMPLLVNAVTFDLPQNAILFTDWDLLYPYYYASRIQHNRTDLTFIETFPRDDADGLADSVLDYVAVNLPARPIYFSERLAEVTDAGYAFVPARVGPLKLFKVVSD